MANRSTDVLSVTPISVSTVRPHVKHIHGYFPILVSICHQPNKKSFFFFEGENDVMKLTQRQRDVETQRVREVCVGWRWDKDREV